MRRGPVEYEMKTLAVSEFLTWAERAGLHLDPQYPHSAVLVFRSSQQHARFWVVPPEPEVRPYFLASFLELMGDWRACYAWRHLGSWPERAEPSRVNEIVELQILKGLGVPLGTADVVSFERTELDKLVTLMFSTTVFGWSVYEDLYIVPDHARHILQTDHHNAIHVSYASSEDLEVWVREMEARGFALPDDLPDETFKKPDWMNDAD